MQIEGEMPSGPQSITNTCISYSTDQGMINSPAIFISVLLIVQNRDCKLSLVFVGGIDRDLLITMI